MRKGSLVATILVSGSLALSTTATADVVTDWNDIALQAVAAAGAGRPGPSGLIDVAMVQVAVHDAMQAYQGRWELYGPAIPNPAGSFVAAVATAAHDVLIATGLTNTNSGTVDSRYQSYLSSRGLTGNAGIEVGHDAAAGVLDARVNNDGRVPPNALQFFGGTNPGDWRPTSSLANGQPMPMVAAYLGTLLTFTLKSPTQFRQEPPPHLASGKYADEFDEVKTLGSLAGSGRTANQTDMALFFADNAVAYWNRTMRTIAGQYFTDSGDTAHMFALVNMAMADSLIVAWNSKQYFNFWRPITAIRLADTDGNRRTDADPSWTSFIATPNYPEYTSGANSLSGAATTMLANVFGTDHVAFSMTSLFVHPTTGQTPANPRNYVRFSDAAQDIVDARIYEGIHFRSADEDGRSQGKHIANWAFEHFLRPVH